MFKAPFLPPLALRYFGLAHAQRLTAGPPLLRYAVALGFFGVALLARFELSGVLPAKGFPFLTFFPAVFLTAYWAGLGPGLLASALSVLAAWYFFFQPDRSFAATGPDLVAIAFFSAILLVDCVVIHLMKEALARVSGTEQRLRESRQQLRRVLDNLQAYVAILDLDGTVREVNEQPLRTGGLAPGSMLGQPLWDTFWWTGDAQREGRLRAAIAQAAAGQTVRFDLEVAPALAGRALTLDFQVGPMRGEGGAITALVASGIDVSARVDAMAALQESRQEALVAAEAAEVEGRLLDTIFEAVPASIIVADARGKLLRMNRATEAIWGLAPLSRDTEGYAEWKGWWADGSARQGRPIGPSEWGLARSLQGQVCSDIVEIEPFGLPGTRRFTLLSSAPVRDPAGEVVGGVVAQLDITRLKHAEAALSRANEQLRDADRQKDEFLATLAHELRNPLAPIRTAAELIRLRNPADDSVQRARATIERQVLHLTRLVDDLLDVSRITLGTVQLRKELLDLHTVALGAIEAARPQLDAADLALAYSADGPPLWVQGDATRLGQCIVNLLTNAAKFTPRGGRVGLRLLDQGPLAVIEVSDNGNGISAENLERIFELFMQERRSGLHGNTGLGIGLALTRKLVALHGGSVQAASAGPGQGSTFRIELPAAPAPGRPGGDTAPPGAVPSAAPGGTRVLLVEDNVDAANLLAELLELSGFEVSVAYDGQSALDAIARDMPDAVLLDIGLPDIDGYEVCRRIRRRTTAARQPVVVALTGWGNGEDRDRSAKAGFNAHLTKPAEPEQIIDLLHTLTHAADVHALP